MLPTQRRLLEMNGNPINRMHRRACLLAIGFLGCLTSLAAAQTQPAPQPESSNPQALQALALGDRAFAKKDLAEAVRQYTAAQQADPHLEAAFIHCGDALVASHQIEAARDQYQKAIDLGTGNTIPLTRHARCVYQLGDVDTAIRDCDQAIADDMRCEDAYMFRGGCYFFKGDSDSAGADYSEAIALDPKNPDPWYAFGLSENAQNHSQGVILAMTEVIQLSPKFALAYCYRGGSNFDLKKYDLCLADGQKAVALDPKSAFAHYVVGEADLGLNNLPDAITEQTAAINLNPQDACAYVDRGLCYEKSGDLNRAIQDYRQATQIDPNLQIAQDDLQNLLSRNSGGQRGYPGISQRH